MKKRINYFTKCLIVVFVFISLATLQVYAGECQSEDIVLQYEYLGECGHTDISYFTLNKDTYITKIRVWFDTSTAGGIDKDSIFLFLSGPDVYSDSALISSNGECQGYWCEGIWNINQHLKAGDYELFDETISMCANPSGQTTLKLYGCEAEIEQPDDTNNNVEGIAPPNGISVIDATANPSSAPVYMGNIASSGGNAGTLSGKMELSVDFPTYNKPVDIWILIGLPDGRFYLADESGKLLNLDSSGFLTIASGASGAKTTKTILTPFEIPSTNSSAVTTPFDPFPTNGEWTVYWLVAPDSNGDIIKALENEKYELGFYIFKVVSDNGFEYGTSKEYAISSTTEVSIDDTVTGNRFKFPNGADGTLIVTPINSAPGADSDDSGSGFKVEYTGTDKIEYVMPYNSGEYPALWVWGNPGVNVYESPAVSEMWLPVSVADRTLNNAAVFDITSPNLSGSSAQRDKLRNKPISAAKLWQKKLDEASWYNKKDVFAEQITSVVKTIVELLPEPAKTNAKTEIDGRLNAYIYPTAKSGLYDRSQYRPFDFITGSTEPTFLFGAIATQRTVVHETGHYLSHVLGGDTVMRLLEGQAVGEHGVGISHSGRPMLEEYAYFTEYTILKEIGGDNTLDLTILSLNPASRDTPSVEGYAVRLLALMTVQDIDKWFSSIYSRSGEDEDVPLINASFEDIWKILSETPITVDELYAKIKKYLSDNGKGDRLAPLLERTGWSYNGYGIVVDAQKNPIQSAIVQSAAKVPSKGENKEYFAPLQPVQTDKNGKFVLDRIFPGSSFIRIQLPGSKEGEYVEFPITIDAKKPTNDSIDLGNFIIDNESVVINAGITDDYHGLRIKYEFSGVQEKGTQEDINDKYMGYIRKIAGTVRKGATEVCINGEYQISAPENSIYRYDLMPGNDTRINKYISADSEGEYNAVNEIIPFSYCMPVSKNGARFIVMGDLYQEGHIIYGANLSAEFTIEAQ